jgi:membrane protease YdiL (CAAX protease family)
MDESNFPASEPGLVAPTQISTGTPLAPKPASSSFMAKVFLGRDGLRSGWSLLLYLCIAAAILTAFNLLHHLQHHKTPLLWGFLIGECVSLIAALVPAVIMARIEKRPFGAYGLPRQGAFGKPFWIGALWGIVALTVLMLIMRAAGAFYFGSLALHGVRILKFAAFWAVMFTLVGLFEEFLLRGYTQFTLGRGIGFWPTAILLSFAFGAIHLHNDGESYVGAAGAAVIGLFFCLTLRRTGNLWFAVGLHMSWDWGETFLYSVPNSGLAAPGHLLNPSFQGSIWLTGGSVGPEASVFVFVVMGLMWLLFHLIYPPTKQQHVEAGLAPPATSTAYQE